MKLLLILIIAAALPFSLIAQESNQSNTIDSKDGRSLFRKTVDKVSEMYNNTIKRIKSDNNEIPMVKIKSLDNNHCPPTQPLTMIPGEDRGQICAPMRLYRGNDLYAMTFDSKRDFLAQAASDFCSSCKVKIGGKDYTPGEFLKPFTEQKSTETNSGQSNDITKSNQTMINELTQTYKKAEFEYAIKDLVETYDHLAMMKYELAGDANLLDELKDAQATCDQLSLDHLIKEISQDERKNEDNNCALGEYLKGNKNFFDRMRTLFSTKRKKEKRKDERKNEAFGHLYDVDINENQVMCPPKILQETILNSYSPMKFFEQLQQMSEITKVDGKVEVNGYTFKDIYGVRDEKWDGADYSEGVIRSDFITVFLRDPRFSHLGKNSKELVKNCPTCFERINKMFTAFIDKIGNEKTFNDIVDLKNDYSNPETVKNFLSGSPNLAALTSELFKELNSANNEMKKSRIEGFKKSCQSKHKEFKRILCEKPDPSILKRRSFYQLLAKGNSTDDNDKNKLDSTLINDKYTKCFERGKKEAVVSYECAFLYDNYCKVEKEKVPESELMLSKTRLYDYQEVTAVEGMNEGVKKPYATRINYLGEMKEKESNFIDGMRAGEENSYCNKAKSTCEQQFKGNPLTVPNELEKNQKLSQCISANLLNNNANRSRMSSIHEKQTEPNDLDKMIMNSFLIRSAEKNISENKEMTAGMTNPDQNPADAIMGQNYGSVNPSTNTRNESHEDDFGRESLFDSMKKAAEKDPIISDNSNGTDESGEEKEDSKELGKFSNNKTSTYNNTPVRPATTIAAEEKKVENEIKKVEKEIKDLKKNPELNKEKIASKESDLVSLKDQAARLELEKKIADLQGQIAKLSDKSGKDDSRIDKLIEELTSSQRRFNGGNSGEQNDGRSPASTGSVDNTVTSFNNNSIIPTSTPSSSSSSLLGLGNVSSNVSTVGVPNSASGPGFTNHSNSSVILQNLQAGDGKEYPRIILEADAYNNFTTGLDGKQMLIPTQLEQYLKDDKIKFVMIESKDKDGKSMQVRVDLDKIREIKYKKSSRKVASENKIRDLKNLIVKPRVQTLDDLRNVEEKK